MIRDDPFPKFDDKLETEDEIREYKKKFVDTLSDSTTNPLSLLGLKLMSNEDLLNRFVQIDNGATWAKWMICWTLRQRFESDKLFGQYIEEFRDATGTLCPSSRKAIYRAWRAGKFCETYKINDLSEIGISKTAIYELSQAVNEDIADKVFETIKHQDVPIPVHEVRRMLEQARAIDGESDIVPSGRVDDDSVNSIESTLDVRVIDYQDNVHDRDEILDQLCRSADLLTEDRAVDELVKLIKTYRKVASLNVLVNCVYKAFEMKL